MTLPDGISGPHYFVVDTGGPYEFLYTDNNRRVSDPVAVTLTIPPDLTVPSVVAPSSAEAGSYVDITWRVFNSGSGGAAGSWYDSVYLSADGNWDLEDRFLGRVRHAGGLAAGASYTGELKNVLLPPALAGQYRILVRTDIFNEVYESADEGNNLRSSAEPIAIEVPELTLGVALDTALVAGRSRLYRIDVPAGETLRITLDSGESAAANEVFLRVTPAEAASPAAIATANIVRLSSMLAPACSAPSLRDWVVAVSGEGMAWP